MKLSDRLERILEAAGCGDTAADIGTDHGFVPVELVRRGQFRRAIACDLRPGPLARAGDHIRKAGLTGRIETRLADGLAAVRPGEADTILLSGMGGPLMERILEEGRGTARSAARLVLSPQSDIPHFREFLLRNGYEITGEDMVCEDGKYYVILTSAPGTGTMWTPMELKYGKRLLGAADPVLAEQIRREIVKLRSIAGRLEKEPTERSRERLREVQAELEEAEEAERICGGNDGQ